MQARKTEYKGIVFDSKAEARFALFLDEQNKNWWYQPKTLTLPDGYTPDFMLLELNNGVYDFDDNPQPMNFCLSMAVIEYKPKRPTQTYIDELALRFKAIGDLIFSEKTLDEMLGCAVNVDMAIMVGGMGYDKAEYLSMSWCGPHGFWIAKEWQKGWGNTFEDVCPDEENKRLSGYRFDLETPIMVDRN
jgi:hypothetical protein